MALRYRQCFTGETCAMLRPGAPILAVPPMKRLAGGRAQDRRDSLHLRMRTRVIHARCDAGDGAEGGERHGESATIAIVPKKCGGASASTIFEVRGEVYEPRFRGDETAPRKHTGQDIANLGMPPRVLCGPSMLPSQRAPLRFFAYLG